MATAALAFEMIINNSKISKINKLACSPHMKSYAFAIQVMLLVVTVSMALLSPLAVAQSSPSSSQQSSEYELNYLYDLPLEELMKLEVVSSAGFFAMERKRSPGN